MIEIDKPEALWQVNLHHDEDSDQVCYALSLIYLDMSNEDFRQKVLGIIDSRIEGNPEKVPSDWPEPDLDKLSKQVLDAGGADLTFFDAQDLILSSSDERWKIFNRTSDQINARGDGMINSELLLEHARDPRRNAKVFLLEGILSLEPENLDLPTKIKYWDHDTLTGIIQNQSSAYKWWEYD